MAFGTGAEILGILQAHGYFIMFLLIMLEGPIFTYVAAFAASLGTFSVSLVLLISICANFSSDLVYYFAGRLGSGKTIKGYVHRILGEKKITRLENLLKHSPARTLAVIKLTPPLPVPGLILAGFIGMPLKRFMLYSSILCAGYASILTFLGYFSGMAFWILSGYAKYGEFLVGAAVILIVGLWFLLRFISNFLSDKIQKL
ncbi:hypothetical protein COV93_06390 [Candidatus Woesearchaeota archaeon CG11_big_fil_rev_8_21_14_0_20_43_8]|nr:MAG: hypothetical protein COV93_06390 [Candidatus Woesearchaeota archaeon CG11_big_fil_rev_8_21_14_0_20_43_8]